MSSLSVFDPTPSADGVQEDPRAPARQQAQPSPLLLIHKGLRGRYPLAFAIGLVLALLFAGLGYFLVLPEYKSVALVRVAPTQARFIYQTEDNAQMANWDSFVGAQVSFMQSRRVVQLALASQRLAAVGWDRGPDGESDLILGLEVSRARGSEIISVAFRHADPVKAQAAVNAIVEAYNELKDETFGLEAGTQERVVQDRVRALQSRLESLRQEEQMLEGRFGVADMETHHRTKTDLLSNWDRLIMDLRQRIAVLRASMPQQASVTPAAQEAEVLTDDQLARMDREFDELLRARVAIDAALRDRPHLREEHREIIGLRNRLAMVEAQILQRRETLLAEPRRAVPNPAEPPPEVTLAQLSTQLGVYEAAYNALRDEVREIGAVRQQLLALRERKEEIKRDLDIAQSRLTALEVERHNTRTGRISIMQMGDVPLQPSTDRRLPLAGAGAVGGLGLGVGLVWLVGFLRSGYRYADDVDDPSLSVPILEILPYIDERDPEWIDLAAHRVHHLRSIINNARSQPSSPLVILISSATAGDGKSYLANALSHSFAISGHSTVVLDADLIGRRLSRRLCHHDKPGLRDAAHENVMPRAYRVQDNLDMVPVGLRDDYQPEQLNAKYLQGVLADLRARYDTVIIDTGPILGSLEAGLLAPLADRVLMVVSRGQRPDLVRAAVSRVRALGAVLAGVVFNRAMHQDYLSRSYSTSVSHRSLAHRTSRPSPSTSSAPMIPLIESMRHSLSHRDEQDPPR
jgi:Mrp family chromosome partitioning ATPase/uncharacterized protein involved in exopolysaccharide biosynthesis